MTPESLNKLLQKYDLGDDFLEDDNRLFDGEFTDLNQTNLESACSYADNKMRWYFDDFQKYYLLADCNRFHFLWLAHFQEYCTRFVGITNPAIGRAYGLWQGQSHMWAWAVVGGELVFINWGQVVSPSQVNYSGKGSMAV